MNHRCLIGLVLLVLGMSHSKGNAQQTSISYALSQALQSKASACKVMITLKPKPNLDSLQAVFRQHRTLPEHRARLTVRYLKQHAAKTQQRVLNTLQEEQVADQYAYWIANVVVATVGSTALFKLTALPEVELISLWDELKVAPAENPIIEQGLPKAQNGAEPGLLAIGARFMWELGYTGHARKLYCVDTGCWPQHPAISNHFLGNYLPLQQAYFPFDSPVPIDKSNSHGTHVIGTVLGLDRATNDTIGAAFNAFWMASDPIVEDLDDVKPIPLIMTAFEWCLNPDGDTTTFDDIPDVINNSWGLALSPGIDSLCQSVVSDILIAVETAGIAAVFSGGNEGPQSTTVGRPAFINTTLVNNFAVGAVDAADASFSIADFSSRGPSVCGGEGSIHIKPEVSAPGVSVRSSVGQSGYAQYSGTSMASPHVSGALLLLKEAFPFLSGEELKLALYYSAIDLGEPGEDNDYGMGIINLQAAYEYLLQTHLPIPPARPNYDAAISTIVLPESGAIFCEGSILPDITIKNLGDSSLLGLLIDYGTVNGILQQFTITDTILSGETLNLSLPAYPLNEAGDVEFFVKVNPLNLPFSEYNTINNKRMVRFTYLPTQAMPFFENFEQGISNQRWKVVNPNYDQTWDTLKTSGSEGGDYSAYMSLGTAIPNNRIDELISANIDVSGQDSLFLSFWVAYAHRSPSVSDTLKVFVSTDCGQSFTSPLFAMGGSELSTVDTNVSKFVPSVYEHWRMHTIDLQAYEGNQELMLKFTTKNRRGNYLFLDNINLSSGAIPIEVPFLPEMNLRIFPNPATDLIEIVTNVGIQHIELQDMVGRVLFEKENKNGVSYFSIAHVPNGAYTLRCASASGHQVVKQLYVLKP